ncbi:uncharacterized protein [Epargyreus clarus]|uniref:uncharacterized protein n=1 Tax=Epargyreus clarus TaxID=520877 RepID=UPI003C2DD8B5
MDPMDGLVEEEDSPYVENIVASKTTSWIMFNPITFLLQFLESYGWLLVFSGLAAAYFVYLINKHTDFFREKRRDALYKKDPDLALAREEAVQRAREEQQRRLQLASQQALELQKEREEKKRAEALERLQKYGAAAGNKLGTADDDYMPLSAGASTSSYRPPKRSKCGGGGCGR